MLVITLLIWTEAMEIEIILELVDVRLALQVLTKQYQQEVMAIMMTL